ncbi:MAG: efflux RND transporter periplasmic adaptor subunit [Burkholderiaceae bacterium]
MIIMLICVGIVLGGLVGFHYFGLYMMKKYMASNTAPPATVTTTKAAEDDWQSQIHGIGSMRAVRGVDVTTEIAGLVRQINITSGQDVKAGTILVQLNADSDIATLNSLQAAANLAETVLARDQKQLEADAIAQAQVDSDLADLKSKRAQVASQQATIDKKTIRAPFAGRLGITTVNPGQYLNPGDKIVTLQTIDPIYIDFFVPQQQVAGVQIGQIVNVFNDAFPGVAFPAKITAIDPKVDTTTRNVQVEATVPNPKGQLLPGMFGRADVDSGPKQHYVTLPQTAITYNPYGATIFVGKDSGTKDAKGNATLQAQQVFVTTGPTRGDQVAILKGVKSGDEVVTSGQIKLKNGTTLIVDNRIKPLDSANPTPQEQ